MAVTFKYKKGITSLQMSRQPLLISHIQFQKTNGVIKKSSTLVTLLTGNREVVERFCFSGFGNFLITNETAITPKLKVPCSPCLDIFP